MLLSIPSPGDPFLVDAGPFHIRWYGLLLALGVLIAGWIARREFRRRNLDPEMVYSIAIWAVPLGLVGARLYHVVTDWDCSPRPVAGPRDLERRPLDLRGGAGRHARCAGSAAAAPEVPSGWWPTASLPG